MKKLKQYKCSNSKLLLQPATENQKQYLKQKGLRFDESITKKDASVLIASLPATKIQIKQLESKGYDISNGVTIGQAITTLAKIK